MYRWRTLFLLFLAVAVLGLSGCQVEIPGIPYMQMNPVCLQVRGTCRIVILAFTNLAVQRASISNSALCYARETSCLGIGAGTKYSMRPLTLGWMMGDPQVTFISGIAVLRLYKLCAVGLIGCGEMLMGLGNG